MRYMYYEEGTQKQLSMRKVYRLYLTQVDKEQKELGTTFNTWLEEMRKYQILNLI